MRSRLIINFLLLLVALAFSALYLMQPEETTDAPEPISDINVDDITTIRIERPDTETIVLKKSGSDDWRLTQPMQADAEDDRIASILLLPQSGSESRFPATDQKLDRFGLSPAPLTLHYDDETFIVGDTNPLNEEQRYVLYNNEIHLINGRLYQRLNAPLTYYVNPALTPPDSQLTRIRLPHGVISKRDDGWRIIPERLSDSANTIAEQWQSARATYLKRHDPAESAFKPEITLEFAEHESITYRILDTSSAIILARPDIGMQYHLRSDMVEKLLLTKPPQDQQP